MACVRVIREASQIAFNNEAKQLLTVQHQDNIRQWMENPQLNLSQYGLILRVDDRGVVPNGDDFYDCIDYAITFIAETELPR